ncbi:MAG: ATP-binding protein [Spirochaetales bacterium]
MLSGRYAELNYLSTCLDRLPEPHSTGVLISGTAGIGKTSVLNALAKKASARGYMACRVYLGDYGPASPFELWRRGMSEWIEQATRIGRDDAVQSIMSESWDVLSGLAPDLFARYGRRASCDHSRRADPRIDNVSRRLSEEIRLFFHMTSRILPFVFIVDNIHSADSDSLALIPEIAPEVEGQAVLFLGSFRPERIVPGTAAADTIGYLQSYGSMHTIELGPLNEADVREYLYDHGMSVSVESVTAMYSLSGGHPLILEELRELFDDPKSSESAASLVLNPLSDNTLSRLRAVTEQRISDFRGLKRRILESAAVLGTDLCIDAVVHCMECTREEVVETMHLARRRGMLERDPERETEFRFRHWLLEESIAATMDPDVKRRVHMQAAEYLYRTVHEKDIGRLRRIAGHFFEAGDGRGIQLGIKTSLEAGRFALHLGAWREAGSFVSELEQHYRVRMQESERVELDLLMAIVMLYNDSKPQAHERVRRAIGRLTEGVALGESLELILRPEIEELYDRDFGDLLRELLPGIAESHWINRSSIVDISTQRGHLPHAADSGGKPDLLQKFEQLAGQNGLEQIVQQSVELRTQFGSVDTQKPTRAEVHAEVRARHAVAESYRVLFLQGQDAITQRIYAGEALELCQETGNAFLIAEAYHGLFCIACRSLNLDEARRIGSAGLDVYPVHDPLLAGLAQVESLAGHFQQTMKFIARLRRNAGHGAAGPSLSQNALGAALHSVAVMFGGTRSLLYEAQEILSHLLSRRKLSQPIRGQAMVHWAAGQCYLDRLGEPEGVYSQVRQIEPGPLLTRAGIERTLMLIAAANGWERRVQEHFEMARSWCDKLGDRGTQILTMVEASNLLSGGARIGASRLSPSIGTYKRACTIFAQARAMASHYGLDSVPGLMHAPGHRIVQPRHPLWPTQTLPRAFQSSDGQSQSKL